MKKKPYYWKSFACVYCFRFSSCGDTSNKSLLIYRLQFSTPCVYICFFISNPYALRCILAAAITELQLPAVGSMTTSSGSVNRPIRRLSNGNGFCVGCVRGIPRSRGNSIQFIIISPLLLNFGNLSRYNIRPYSQLPTTFILAFNTCAE